MSECTILDNVIVEATIDTDQKVVEATMAGETVVQVALSTTDMTIQSVGGGVPVYQGSAGSVETFNTLSSSDSSVLIELIGGGGIDLKADAAAQLQIFELKSTLKTGQTTYYSEFTNDSDGNPTDIDKWKTASKLDKLFTKVITWVDGNPTKTVTTDETTGAVLTVDITYDGNDYIETITEALT